MSDLVKRLREEAINAIQAFLGVGFVIYICLCALLVPEHIIRTYLSKRDCELLNQARCELKMMPAELTGDSDG